MVKMFGGKCSRKCDCRAKTHLCLHIGLCATNVSWPPNLATSKSPASKVFMTQCLHCAHEFEGNHCPNCGQKASTSRLTFRQVAHDLQHSLLHLDKGVVKNIRSIWQPSLIRGYIAGQRAGFFNPIVLLLFVCGVMAFVEQHFQVKMAQQQEGSSTSTAYHVGQTAAALYHEWAKYLEAFLVIPFAVFAWLFLKKKTGYNLIEHLYAQSFVVCNMNLLGLLMYPILRHYSPVFALNFMAMGLLILLNYGVYTHVTNKFARFLVADLVVGLGYFTFILIFLLTAWVVVEVKGG